MLLVTMALEEMLAREGAWAYRSMETAAAVTSAKCAHSPLWSKRTFFLGGMSVRIVLTRLRLLITSVLREIGRGRPCSLRNRPQALQSTEPNSSRRHNGVVEVLQFWQVGCEDALEAIISKM